MYGLVKWIIGFLVFVMAIVIAGALLLYGPYSAAENSMADDAVFTLHTNDDGTLLLSWPEGENADRYQVEVLMPYTGHERLYAAARGEKLGKYDALYSETTELCSCVLPADLPTDRALTIRVNTERDYLSVGGITLSRGGSGEAEVTCNIVFPGVSIFADPNSLEARITWTAMSGDAYRLFVSRSGGTWQEISDCILYEGAGEAVISFGEGGRLPMPDHGDEFCFALTVSRSEAGLELDGLSSAPMRLVREDLMGTALLLEYADEGENVYTLTWNETKGESYEVQLLDSEGEWSTVAVLDGDDERSYCTGHLEPFTSYVMRVVTKGGQTLPDSDSAAVSAPIQLRTAQSAIYATVWPLMELSIYSDASRTEVVGTAQASEAFCVLEETDGMFLVYFTDGYGYIDSNYCLINLPEYLGSLCSYDITNSYSSIYMVHEYEIPNVTDTIVKGYDQVQMYDGDFLVPLIYPTAQKLVTAALAAAEQGYRLKIYDSFRPGSATRSIYDLTQEVMNDPIPDETFTGKSVAGLPKVNDDEELTYQLLMTNGVWSLSSFLAPSGSTHNIGIALDLTLESIYSGEELEMQTSMHDLSWYSAIGMNNGAADTLSDIMTGAGFSGIASEWWHFQDNAASARLGLRALWDGVAPACWIKDDAGWRYRLSDGSYCKNLLALIDGAEYTFDADGYLIE